MEIAELAYLKSIEAYPTFVYYDVSVPPQGTIHAYMHIPEEYVFHVRQEVHDVAVDVFEHQCFKDGKEILPRTRIGGATMTLKYDFIVYGEWHGIVRNIVDEWERFRLRVDYDVYPRKEYFKELELAKRKRKIIK